MLRLRLERTSRGDGFQLLDSTGRSFDESLLANGWLDPTGLHFWVVGTSGWAYRTVYLPLQPRCETVAGGRRLVTCKVAVEQNRFNDVDLEVDAHLLHEHDVDQFGPGELFSPLPVRLAETGEFCDLPFDFHDPALVQRAAVLDEGARPGPSRVTDPQVEYRVTLRHLAQPVRLVYTKPPWGWPEVAARLFPVGAGRRWRRPGLTVSAPAGREVRVAVLDSKLAVRAQCVAWTGASSVIELRGGTPAAVNRPQDSFVALCVADAFWRQATGAFVLPWVTANDKSAEIAEVSALDALSIYVDVDPLACSAVLECTDGPNKWREAVDSSFPQNECGLGGQRLASRNTRVQLGPWRLRPIEQRESHGDAPADPPGATDALVTALADLLESAPPTRTTDVEVRFAAPPFPDTEVSEAFQRLERAVAEDGLAVRVLPLRVHSDFARGSDRRETNAIGVGTGALAMDTPANIPISLSLLIDVRGRESRLGLALRGTALAKALDPVLLAWECAPYGLIDLARVVAKLLEIGEREPRRMVGEVLKSLESDSNALSSGNVSQVSRAVERFYRAVCFQAGRFVTGTIRGESVIEAALGAWGHPRLSGPEESPGHLLYSSHAQARLRIAFSGWGTALFWPRYVNRLALPPHFGRTLEDALRQRIQRDLGGLFTNLRIDIDPPGTAEERSWVALGLADGFAPRTVSGVGQSLAPAGLDGHGAKGAVHWWSSSRVETGTGSKRGRTRWEISEDLNSLGFSGDHWDAEVEKGSALGAFLAARMEEALFRRES